MGRYLYTIFFIVLTGFSVKEKQDSDIVSITQSRGTVYSLLNHISDNTGILFIYDSNIIDNNKRVRIRPGDYTLEKAVAIITENPQLSIIKEDKYVLIYYLPPEEKPAEIVKIPEKSEYSIVSGVIADRITQEPVVYATVSLDGHSTGTVTNSEGEFRLRIHDTLLEHPIRFSHLGYQSRIIKSSLLLNQNITFYLDQKITPLQEVVVRVVDPIAAIRAMIANKSRNYNKEPVYITAFYREGIEHKNSMNLTEAVLKIYKPGINTNSSNEQVKVLKMRRVSNPDNSDTLVAKVKSTINSTLLLDIVKNPPDFISPWQMDIYKYSHSDISTIDGRRVNVISFEQKEGISLPLYKGNLYLDAENSALVSARFEVNPDYVHKAKENLVLRLSRGLDITPEKAEYYVSYKQYQDYYYPNHIRGDLTFRVRRKNRLFSSKLNVWFEMANCLIETTEVNPFERDERLLTRTVFSETRYTYDSDFWEQFNIILPEEKVKEYIKRYILNQ